MTAFDSPGYGDSDALFYVRGYGVHLTTLLVGFYVAALIACSLLMAAGQERVLAMFAYDSSRVAFRGEVWRLVTYPLLQPPSFFFLLNMYFLYSFGREVEKFFGRKTFAWLYAAMLVLPVVLLTGGEFAGLHTFAGGTLALHTGVFALFVFVYPGVRFALIPVTALVWLFILLGIYSFMDLAGRDLAGLFLLWSTVGIAYLGVRMAGAGGGFAFLERLQNSLPRRRAPATTRATPSSSPAPGRAGPWRLGSAPRTLRPGRSTPPPRPCGTFTSPLTPCSTRLPSTVSPASRPARRRPWSAPALHCCARTGGADRGCGRPESRPIRQGPPGRQPRAAGVVLGDNAAAHVAGQRR